MPQSLHIEKLANGLTVLAEPMPWLQSVSFTLLIPAGTWREQNSLEGLAGLTLDMVQRGAGDRDSRAIVEALDFLGVERNSSVTTYHTSFSAAMMAETLEETLGIYADIVQSPHLPDDELVDSRQGALQELRALNDDPVHRCFTELKRQRFAPPLGRISFGTMEGLLATSIQDVQSYFNDYFTPQDAILAVAGNLDWPMLKDLATRLFSDWRMRSVPSAPDVEVRSTQHHLDHDSQQTHIALAYECVPYNHLAYYQARGLVGVLSDGMSSRLFTEVREKRGLVYSISANCQSLGTRGSVMCYAGTTSERAQETLDVTLKTVQSLADGISEGELFRLKSRIKSSLVLEQESSSARSSQIATDWHYLGRVPSMKELAAEIDSLSCRSLVEHFTHFPPSNWTMVTLGKEPLEMPIEVPKYKA